MDGVPPESTAVAIPISSFSTHHPSVALPVPAGRHHRHARFASPVEGADEGLFSMPGGSPIVGTPMSYLVRGTPAGSWHNGAYHLQHAAAAGAASGGGGPSTTSMPPVSFSPGQPTLSATGPGMAPQGSASQRHVPAGVDMPHQQLQGFSRPPGRFSPFEQGPTASHQHLPVPFHRQSSGTSYGDAQGRAPLSFSPNQSVQQFHRQMSGSMNAFEAASLGSSRRGGPMLALSPEHSVDGGPSFFDEPQHTQQRPQFGYTKPVPGMAHVASADPAKRASSETRMKPQDSLRQPLLEESDMEEPAVQSVGELAGQNEQFSPQVSVLQPLAGASFAGATTAVPTTTTVAAPLPLDQGTGSAWDKDAGNVKAVVFGLINGTVGLPALIAFAAIVFKAPAYAPFLDTLCRFFFLSSAIHQLVFVLFSSIPFAIGQVQDVGLIFLSAMASAIAIASEEQGLTDKVMLGTTLLTMTLSTFVVGVLTVVVGRFRLAQLVQYVPLPVVGGYLGYVGYFCIAGGIALGCTAEIDNLLSWRNLLTPDAGIKLIPTLATCITLMMTMEHVSHPLALPAVLFTIPIIFHMVLFVTGITLEQAQDAGWAMRPTVGDKQFWQLWKLFNLQDGLQGICWPALFAQAPKLVGLFLVVCFGSCMDVAAIQQDVPRPLDFNRELITVGVSNCVVGLIGVGYTGSYIFSQTVFTMRAGVFNRLNGLVVAVMEAAVFVLPFSVVQYMPNFFFGALLLWFGVEISKDWLLLSIRKLSLPEYLLLWLTFAFIMAFDLERGIVLGVVAATLYFAYSYAKSQVTAVREVPASSGSVHSMEVAQVLDVLSDRVTTCSLAGFIFFGSSISIADDVNKVADKMMTAVTTRYQEAVQQLQAATQQLQQQQVDSKYAPQQPPTPFTDSSRYAQLEDSITVLSPAPQPFSAVQKPPPAPTGTALAVSAKRPVKAGDVGCNSSSPEAGVVSRAGGDITITVLGHQLAAQGGISQQGEARPEQLTEQRQLGLQQQGQQLQPQQQEQQPVQEQQQQPGLGYTQQQQQQQRKQQWQPGGGGGVDQPAMVAVQQDSHMDAGSHELGGGGVSSQEQLRTSTTLLALADAPLYIILNMRQVTNVDATGARTFSSLVNSLGSRGIHVLFVGLRPTHGSLRRLLAAHGIVLAMPHLPAALGSGRWRVLKSTLAAEESDKQGTEYQADPVRQQPGTEYQADRVVQQPSQNASQGQAQQNLEQHVAQQKAEQQAAGRISEGPQPACKPAQGHAPHEGLMTSSADEQQQAVTDRKSEPVVAHQGAQLLGVELAPPEGVCYEFPGVESAMQYVERCYAQLALTRGVLQQPTQRISLQDVLSRHAQEVSMPDDALTEMVAKLSSHTEELHIHQGQVLLQAGHVVDKLLLVQEGLLQLEVPAHVPHTHWQQGELGQDTINMNGSSSMHQGIVDKSKLSFYSQGCWVLATEFFLQRPAPGCVTCVSTPCSVMAISHTNLLQMMRDAPAALSLLQWALLRFSSMELSEARDRADRTTPA